MASFAKTPLLPDLLHILHARRGTGTLFCWNTAPSDDDIEDRVFVRALNQALEVDLANGTLDGATLQHCAVEATVHLVPPRRDPPGSNTIEHTQWARAGEPWVEVDKADPRERLLARLVHQGADPWAHTARELPDKTKEVLADTLAASWLSYGYANLFRMALDTAPASFSANALGARREDNDTRLPTLLQSACEQDLTEAADLLIARGANTDGALQRAKSPEMVRRLLEAGADIDARIDSKLKTDVIQHWLNTLGAKKSRAMIDMAQDYITPTKRFERAAVGTNWGPLNDAIGAYPQWTQATAKLGQVQVRWPLYLLMTRARKEPDYLKQAFRLLAKVSMDEREVLPGVSEKALLRLTLDRLVREYAPGSSHDAAQLSANIAQRLRQACAGQPTDILEHDAAAFLVASEPLSGTRAGSMLAEHLLTTRLVVPREKGLRNFQQAMMQRSLDDLFQLGRAAKLFFRKGYSDPSSDSYEAIFGLNNVTLSQHYGLNSVYRKWVDELARKHPQRLDEIASAAMGMLGVGLSVRLNGGVREAVWNADILRVANWLSQGVDPGWKAADLERLAGVANNIQNPQATTQAFITELTTRADKQTLDAIVPEASTQRLRTRL